jgi:AraC-like DNA-binding protein/mannose-6-phosphate isomerase-like protein (cupin superfamily)
MSLPESYHKLTVFYHELFVVFMFPDNLYPSMKTVLHKSEIPPTRIFVVKDLNEKHFDPVWHAHSEYQLFVVLEGTGTRFIGDHIKSFKPGELIFTGPYIPHVWRSDEQYFKKESKERVRGIVIYFNENFLGDQFLEKEEIIQLKKLFLKSLRGLEFYGQKKQEVIDLMRELPTMEGLTSVIRILHILEILSRTKEYHYISSRAYSDTLDQHETDRLNQVYEYVFKNYRKKIRLQDLADMVHMTPTSFSRYFTMRNNKSFSRFLAEIRIKHACELLTETDEPIAQISYACGFDTLSNFNKQFREITHRKPTEYKKEFMSI